jgi:hypothetical protein
MQFAAAQSLTATGYVNNVNAVVDLGPGRFTGMLALDLSVLDQTTGDETYKIHLFGSNDLNFGNGNVESLYGHDWGASANRSVATILGSNYAGIPPTNLAGYIFAAPFTNFVGGIVYRYAKLYLVAAGTTPIFTVLNAWISPIEMKV